MTQIRPYMGGIGAFEESMKRAVHVNDVDDVVAFVRCHFPHWNPKRSSLVQIECGVDNRGSPAWLIRLRNVPALWADGPVEGIATFAIVGRPLKE